LGVLIASVVSSSAARSCLPPVTSAADAAPSPPPSAAKSAAVGGGVDGEGGGGFGGCAVTNLADDQSLTRSLQLGGRALITHLRARLDRVAAAVTGTFQSSGA
jgi:hypothetical protein